MLYGSLQCEYPGHWQGYASAEHIEAIGERTPIHRALFIKLVKTQYAPLTAIQSVHLKRINVAFLYPRDINIKFLLSSHYGDSGRVAFCKLNSPQRKREYEQRKKQVSMKGITRWSKPVPEDPKIR